MKRLTLKAQQVWGPVRFPRFFSSTSAAEAQFRAKLEQCQKDKDIETLFLTQGKVATPRLYVAAVQKLGDIKTKTASAVAPTVLPSLFSVARNVYFPSQDLSRMCYKLANYRLESKMPTCLQEKLIKVSNLETLTEEELSNFAWSLTRLQHEDSKDLFEKISFELDKRAIHRFSPHDISTLCWAFAAEDHFVSMAFLERFLQTPKTFGSFRTSSLINLLWACSKFCVHYDIPGDETLREMFVAVNERANLKDVKLETVGHLLWSLGKMGGSDLASPALVVTENSKEDFSKKSFCEVVWALATLQHPPSPALFQKLEETLARLSLTTEKGPVIFSPEVEWALEKLNITR